MPSWCNRLCLIGVAGLLACGQPEVQPQRAQTDSSGEPRPAAAPDATDGARSEAPLPARTEPEAGPAPDAAPARSAAELHREAIVIDTHNDVTLRLVDEPTFDFGRRSEKGYTDLVRMREGGLDAEFLSVWVNPRDFQGEQAWERSLAMFAAIHRTVEKNADAIVLARTAAEVRAASREGKVAFLVGVEGAHALGEFGSEAKALERIGRWYDLGARYLTLTWTNSNALGGSSGDHGKARGLTPLGRRVIQELNDLGMMVDVSHVSDPTFLEAIAASRLPVLASHSGARSLSDHGRNLSDDMLRALAKNGGAACVVFYPGFLDSEWAAANRKARASGAKNEVTVPLSRLVEHLDHFVKVAGIDHVCLGSDFDGIGQAPVGLEDVSKLPNLTAALLERGYSERDVRKILGENVLRVLEANERGRRPATVPDAVVDDSATSGD